MSELLTRIDLDGGYSIEVFEGEVVINGCDCADSIGDFTRILKLYHALGDLLVRNSFL